MKYSMLVKKMIEKPSNPSVWDTIKIHLWEKKKIYFASTIKSPYLLPAEAELVIEELKKRYQEH